MAMMDTTLLLHPHATVRFRVSSASATSIKQSLMLRNPTLSHSLFNLAEIVGSLSFGKKENSRPQFVTCSINPNGSERGRSPRKNSTSRRIAKEAKTNQSKSSKSKVDSADQEEIISLFRRIQSSIAKEVSEDSEKESSDSPVDKPAAEKVLEIIRSSRKQTGDNASLKGGTKETRRSPSKRERGFKAEDTRPMIDVRSSRPPSNFTKRSPIPFPSAPRRKEALLISEVSPVFTDQLQKLEDMKLPELKELAKSRGVKGYSKLKKKELVELLRS